MNKNEVKYKNIALEYVESDQLVLMKLQPDLQEATIQSIAHNLCLSSNNIVQLIEFGDLTRPPVVLQQWEPVNAFV